MKKKYDDSSLEKKTLIKVQLTDNLSQIIENEKESDDHNSQADIYLNIAENLNKNKKYL